MDQRAEIVLALRAPSFEQDSAWHSPAARYATKPRALLDAAADALSARSTGEHLYLSFWRRNDWQNPTPWAEQSEAIRGMWDGIAADAVAIPIPT